jgi:NTE family protein
MLLKPDRKVGLILGSGAARGFAQIGVIKALVEKNIPIDMIAGTSVGAIIGACYAKMYSTKERFLDVFSKTDWRQLFLWPEFNLNGMMRGIFRTNKTSTWLKDVLGGLKFSDLKVPLAIVTTDAHTGEEVVLRKGSVLDAVRASVSIPALFPPVRLGKRFLVDGAFVNPVPVELAKDMGANYLIACDTTRSNKEKDHKETAKRLIRTFDRRNKMPVNNAGNMFKILKQTLHAMEGHMVDTQLHKADLVISPDVGHIDLLAFSKGKEAVIKGYMAGKKAIRAYNLA